MKRGQIVFVTAGKEKGQFMIILSSDEKMAMLTDGRHRPCDRPKKKSKKHISETKTIISEEDLAANSRIKSILRNFTAQI